MRRKLVLYLFTSFHRVSLSMDFGGTMYKVGLKEFSRERYLKECRKKKKKKNKAHPVDSDYVCTLHILTKSAGPPPPPPPFFLLWGKSASLSSVLASYVTVKKSVFSKPHLSCE